MQIRTIITQRFLLKWRSWQIVYEWEDVFRKEMKTSFSINLDQRIKKEKKLIKLLFDSLQVSSKWESKPGFVFYMIPYHRFNQRNNSPYVIPCIIDWYLKTNEQLEDFFKKFSNHRLILVSSMQVYQFLKTINTPIPIGHLPLSLSDKYKITPETTFKKDLDVVLMGRQNPVLLNWLKQYSIKHPNLCIVSSEREKDKYRYYTQNGTYIAKAKTRNQYMSLMRRSRISLYSTKAIDDDNSVVNANGFNQMTPRFFEILATGNHVIARFIKNEDTDYFEIEKICPNTNSYESFERQMDYALTHPVNMKLYSDYLEKHYTSTRVKMLEELVKTL